jgi:RNA polymerase sigma-70 factor (ECF subfamily)
VPLEVGVSQVLLRPLYVLRDVVSPQPSAGTGVLIIDERSLAELAARFGPMVYRRARAILGDAEEARDVVQDVFLKILGAGADSDGLSSWLYRVTTNACLNRLRAKRRYHAMCERSTREVVEGPGISLDQQCTVRQLLAEAEPDCAVAAVYVHIEGMSHEEVGLLLGVSRRTVGNLLERFAKWARAKYPELHLGGVDGCKMPERFS